MRFQEDKLAKAEKQDRGNKVQKKGGEKKNTEKNNIKEHHKGKLHVERTTDLVEGPCFLGFRCKGQNCGFGQNKPTGSV